MYFKNIEDAVFARKNKEIEHSFEIERQLKEIAPIIFGEANE